MNPRSSNSSLPKTGRSAYGVATAAALLLIPVIVLAGGDAVREFLDFGAGVLSLVALSCSVIWGLVASDRLFLSTRQRIVSQAVHRTTAISSVAFLLLHVTVKIALEHAPFYAALIPFSLGFTGTAILIGFGSIAGLLMITTAITGALRSAFMTRADVAARWRVFHMLAYPAWCFALVHGLYAGREAKPVFIVLYSLCLVGVAGALILRAAPRPFKRRVADTIVSVLGTDTRPGREQLDASRARMAEATMAAGAGRGSDAGRGAASGRDRGADSPLPGMGSRGGNPLGDTMVPPQRTPSPSAGLYDSGSLTDAPDPAPGFAAAYRAVSATPRAQDPLTPEPTQRMDLPLDMQPTEAVPRYDDGSTTGTRWPAPSPPPVGEAPPSAYDPMQDTFAGQTFAGQAYPGQTYAGTPETSYGTAETNAPYDTYNPNDTYNSGPATETLPGSYDYERPGSGEPWNAPSGGFK
ncbi:cytochrome b/b6 domain-containing protein [Streptomyces acidicola]|uniref:cytochrome b/b6 domain-containing protein n=1 Tax=Streptomyces acidicola TaxID=2596892 RepID=UPI0037981785